MKLRALVNFSLQGEDHAKGEVFDLPGEEAADLISEGYAEDADAGDMDESEE